ncbi:MAG TPA: ROK family protein, partial [Anaerolineaceae bacterium]|nr:ROK family protein [Anaerolineaceae bacterium]
VPIQSVVAKTARLAVSALEKELIDVIRQRGEATKSELIIRSEYSRAKINGSIASLLKKKIIKPAGAGDYTGGRRSVKYQMNGEVGLVTGIDIGATSIDIVLADLAGKVYGRTSEPASVREGPRAVLEQVYKLLDTLMAESGHSPEQLFAAGVGVPGPVDFSNGMVVSPPIMPGWDGYPIAQAIQDRYANARAVVDNDVNVMALGEKYYGIGQNVANLIFVKIGTGIGSGIICNGKIYRGSNGCAGDIGHISVKKDGPMCHCGNLGCLEAMAAGPAIAETGVRAVLDGKSAVLKKFYDLNGGRLRAEDVGLAAGEGDPVAIEIIRSCGQMIGDVLAGLVNFYNPGAIVIGGGVSNLGNFLLSSIRQAVLNRSLPLATRDLRIVFSAMGPDAGISGATALAIDHIFSVDGLQTAR